MTDLTGGFIRGNGPPGWRVHSNPTVQTVRRQGFGPSSKEGTAGVHCHPNGRPSCAGRASASTGSSGVWRCLRSNRGNQRSIQTFGAISSGSAEPSGLQDAPIGQPRSEMPPPFGHLGAIPGVSVGKRHDNDLARQRKPSGEARCSTKVAMLIRPFLGKQGRRDAPLDPTRAAPFDFSTSEATSGSAAPSARKTGRQCSTVGDRKSQRPNQHSLTP